MKNLPYILLLFVAMLMSSCRTCQPITNIEYRDSIRVVQRTDSVFVMEKDSVFVQAKNDTIYQIVYKYRLKDRIVQQTDTCYLQNEVKVVEQVQVVPSYYKRIHIAFWLIVIIIVLIVALKIYLKFKP